MASRNTHPKAIYHLRYLKKNGKRVWEAIGSDPQLALIAKSKRERMLAARAAGLEVSDTDADNNLPSNPGSSTPLPNAIEEYLSEIKTHKSQKTFAAYNATLLGFQVTCKKAR